MGPRAPFFPSFSRCVWGGLLPALSSKLAPGYGSLFGGGGLPRGWRPAGPPAHLLVFDADQSQPRSRPRGRLGVEGAVLAVP